MKLFIAVKVPEFPKLEGLINVDQYHLSLLYLGEADLEATKKRLSRFLFKSFTITTGTKLDCFSSWFRCRTVYVPVKTKALLTLGAQLRAFLGYKDKFVPHITLARCKEHPKPELVEYLKQVVLEPKEITVSEIGLYSSELTARGAVFKLEKKIKLS